MNDSHTRAWFVVFVVAVFAAGVGAGSLLERYLRPPAPAFRDRPMPAGRMREGRGGAPDRVMTRTLGQRLQLTPEQQKQVDDIFARRGDRLAKIRADINERFRAEQRDFREEIKKLLTPDQQQRFDRWLQEEPVPGMRRPPGRGMRPGRGSGPAPDGGPPPGR